MGSGNVEAEVAAPAEAHAERPRRLTLLLRRHAAAVRRPLPVAEEEHAEPVERQPTVRPQVGAEQQQAGGEQQQADAAAACN